MASNNLILKRMGIEAFGGIDSENPIILDLTEHYAQGRNIALAEGDQGTGKTSWLTGLYHLLTGNLFYDKANVVNTKDGGIKLDDEFEVSGIKYRVKTTKSRFTLERFWEYGEEEKARRGEEGSWKSEESPKTLLKELIGNIGISPMFLKDKDGKQQIEWFRKVFGVSAELEAEQDKLKNNFKLAYDARTEANRNYTRIKNILEASDLFINWEQSEKTYAEEKKIEDVQKKFDLAEANKNRYDDNVKLVKTTKEETIPGIDKKISDIDNQIKLLQQAKEDQIEKRQAQVQRASEIEAIIEKDKNVISEYQKAKEEFSTVSTYLMKYNEWKNIVKQKDEMDKFEDAIIKLDNQKDALQQQIRELTKQFTPDVEGLEICVPNEDEKREGIYYKNMTLQQLSESELWGLFLKIWDKLGVRFVFIENITDLGSEAVETLNSIAKNGIKIFATQMNRQQKSIKISFVEQIK